MSNDKDTIAELDEAIEKARGLLPRGGSAQTARGLGKKLKVLHGRLDSGKLRLGDGIKGQRLERAMRYLQGRNRNEAFNGKKDPKAPLGSRARTGRQLRRGVYKSLDALDDVIEKALRINGGVKVSPAQRRSIAMGRRRNFNLERTKRIGSAQYGGSKQKPFSNPGARGPTRQVSIGSSTRSAVTRRVAQRAKTDPSKQNKRTLKLVRGNNAYVVDSFRRRRGEASPYKGTLFGGLKRIHKAKPKTLYVYRPLLNADDIIAWAKAQGFGSTLNASDMHATVAFSKTPLNWAKLGDDWCAEDPRPGEGDRERYAEAVSWSDGGRKQKRIEGGAREVKALGDKGAVVLAFQSPSLTERWAQFIRIGASWDYAGYTPHLSISYSAGDLDLSKIEPYRGPILLGEEDWNEIVEGAGENIAEIPTGADVKKSIEKLERRLAKLETPAEAA